MQAASACAPRNSGLWRSSTELRKLPPGKELDLGGALDAIASEFPSVTDFEREFPSLCFALANGVGKTRLMEAFISYLHLSHGINNFFVLAPNLTIYNKLIADFTPNKPKYVFTAQGAKSNGKIWKFLQSEMQPWPGANMRAITPRLTTASLGSIS